MMLFATLDDVRQTAMHFLAQETQHTADLLQRDMPATKFFDDEDFDQICGRVDTVAALALGHDDALFIPPLQLARGDACEIKDIACAEAVCQHRRPVTSKHFCCEMFDAIFHPAVAGVNPSLVFSSNLSYSTGNCGHSHDCLSHGFCDPLDLISFQIGMHRQTQNP